MARLQKPFQIPKHGPTYIGAIFERCEDLINHGIWMGLHIQRLRSWRANFRTDEEKYFAACVLDALIYRSKDQTIALTHQLFQRVLADLARVDPPSASASWQDELMAYPAGGDPGVRFVPVVRPDDPPVKSGYVVARLLKQHLRINPRWIINGRQVLPHVGRGVRAFFFIDDFLGTGDQFEKFIQSLGLSKHLPAIYAAYVPLAAHTRGIRRLQKRFPTLRVRPVETLDEHHSLFHPESECFNDGVNTPRCVKTFYYAFLRKRGLKIYGQDRRGYGHLEVAYAFEHAVPDNCLPMLWWPETSAWTPLFLR